jgi:3-deoxy-D-manno-octulosonic-acid transferase
MLSIKGIFTIFGRILLDTAKEKSKNSIMYIIYNIILIIAAIIITPYFLLKILFAGKYRKSFIQKLGGRQKKILTDLTDGPRVWIHAVSVGEVTAAAPIVACLKKKRPEVKIIFSTTTETGREMAEKFIREAAALIYFPLDIPVIVRHMINMADPDVFVLVETELWPNFLKICKERRIKTLLVNGRISPWSYRRYRRTAFFWKKALGYLDFAGMISVVDAERIKDIGMDSAGIKVLGNAKYDGLASKVSPLLRQEITRRLNVTENERFFVAGSTHPGEDEIIIKVYKKLVERYPDFKLIIVPRHIERTNDIINLLRQANLNDVITLANMNNGRQRKNERIIVVNVIGELFKVYSLASIVYCGGSLVPKGGQNILEAAAWGKVVFYGPSMEDFSQEKTLLEEAGCGITIRNEEELFQGIIQMLNNPEELVKRGENGTSVILANIGASARYADLISKYI